MSHKQTNKQNKIIIIVLSVVCSQASISPLPQLAASSKKLQRKCIFYVRVVYENIYIFIASERDLLYRTKFKVMYFFCL